ncbi:MAG: fimbrial protein [Silvania sp.]|uniref:fimbrial protein n=1 Tax=Silvania sp. TaxID=3016633 RepID=UPI003EE5D4CD
MKRNVHYRTVYSLIQAHLKKLIFIIGLSLLISNQALALRCQSADNGSLGFSENIGSIAVPQSVPDGTVIWRSENRTMRISCWKDRGGEAENVYLYPNPLRLPLATGIEYGIVLNGNTIDMNAYQVALPITIPVCNYSSEVCKNSYPVVFTFSYNVFIKKKGAATGYYSGFDAVNVFQLDGANGLNVEGNFTYVNYGLNSIRFMPCSANISISPNVITFDTVNAFNAAINEVAAPEKTFTATVTKDCTAPFKLTAQYTSPSPLSDTTGLNLGNGLKLSLKNVNTSQYVDFSNVTPFADMTSVMSATVPFTTRLTYLSTSPTVGDYSTSVTITVFYN